MMTTTTKTLLVSLTVSLAASLSLGACATSTDTPHTSAPTDVSAAIYERTVGGDVETAMTALEAGLTAEGFGVVFRANIGASLAKKAESFGDDYNRSKLDEIRSVVFCNPKYANKASNEDPRALALCPLRITLVEKAGSTRLLFVKPTLAAGGTAAADTAQTVETMVIRAIDSV